MSLKTFHLVFIAVSTLLAFGFGVWAVRFHFTHGHATFLILGLLSFVIGVILIFYGIKFLDKLRHIHLF